MNRTDSESPSGVEERLAALRQSGLLDTPPEESFDRLTRLAGRLLRAPVALVSLVESDHQFFKSQLGLPEPWATLRRTPLSHSFCQFVVRRREPLVISDARDHPQVHDNDAITDLGVIAYAGIPLVTADGYVLGAFCAIDHQPRTWSSEELAILQDLAALACTEIALRGRTRELERQVAARDVSEARLAALAEDAPVGIFRTDAAGNCVYVNHHWCRLTGVPPEQAMGDGWVAAVHPDDRGRVAAAWRTCIAAGGGFHAEYRFLRRSEGISIWVNGQATPEYDPIGALTGYIGTVADITDAKRVERLLASQRAVLQSVATESPFTATLELVTGEIEAQIEGARCSVLLANEEGTRLYLGAAPSFPDSYNQQIDGMGIGPVAGSCGTAAYRRELVVVDDIARDPLWQTFRSLALEHQLRACWSHPVFTPDGRLVGTFAMYFNQRRSPRPFDLEILRQAAQLTGLAIERRRSSAERERLLQAEQQARLSAEAAAQIKDEFLAVAAHEFKTPLTLIKGNVELVLRRLTDSQESAVVGRLDALSRACDRLTGLVQTLLEVSRFSGGGRWLKHAPLELDVLLQSVCARMQRLTTGHQFRVSAEPALVLGEQEHLEQALVNLLSNAVRFSPAGGAIDVSLRCLADEAVVAIADAGIGIPAARRDGVFERFFRAHDGPERDRQGLGVGLHLSRQIIDQHGGRMWFESEEGKGSVFSFSLPVLDGSISGWSGDVAAT